MWGTLFPHVDLVSDSFNKREAAGSGAFCQHPPFILRVSIAETLLDGNGVRVKGFLLGK